MSGSSPNLVAIYKCGSGDMFLVCHVILEDHVLKGSRDFVGGSPSW